MAALPVHLQSGPVERWLAARLGGIAMVTNVIV